MTYATGTTPVEAVAIEGGDGTPALVVTLPAGTEVPGVTTDNLPEPTPEVEAVETVADSAVEIAQIEADKEVAIAEIHAEVETAHIEARAEGDERVTECLEAMTHLRADLSALAEAVTATATVVEQLVASQSTPQPLAEVTPETMTDTSETATETSSETGTEVPAKSAEEKPVAVMRRKVRMI